MKKILCVVLSVLLLIPYMVSADGGNVSYVKSAEEYDYGSYEIYLAAEKSTGRIIPLSIGPLDGNAYAYLPGGGEIEIKKVKPLSFSDIDENDVYEWTVNELSARGVLGGFEDGTFRKDKVLSRAEMAAVFARLFDVKIPNLASCFSDVDNSYWARDYIMALVDMGVFSKNDVFCPNQPVTREQLAAMTSRMLSAIGYGCDEDEYDYSQIMDMDAVSDYAKGAYRELMSNNYRVINDFVENDMFDTADDETYLVPQKSVTRYECAIYLDDFIRAFFQNNAPAIRRSDAPDAEIPVLDGSTSTHPITQNIYYAYYENAENCPDYPKKHSKTSVSYKRLIDGEVEMIFVPDPSDDVKKYAEEKGVKLRYIPIANEALIFFTSSKNKADNITTQQLYDIYVNNSVHNWNEIGGDDAELVPYCRNNDSGSHAQMEKFILNGKEINSDISREHTSWIMSSILTDVDEFNNNNSGKYAMGYSLYYYYFNNQMLLGPLNLKLMSIDGIAPDEDTIASGQYPYTTNYYAVVRDEKNPKVDEFIKLMQGEFGREVISLSGLGTIK